MRSVATNNPNGMDIEWQLSNHCNYSCNYCSPELYGNTSGWPDPDSAIKFFADVHKHINPHDKMITFTGGEPTLWPKLFYFLENIQNYEIGIVSNGSRTLRWWEKLNKLNKVTHLTISVHLEYADVDHIGKVIEIMSEHTGVAVLILLSPEDPQKAINFVERLRDKDLTCRIFLKAVAHRWDGDNTPYEYTQDVLDYVDNWYYWKKNSNAVKSKLGYDWVIDGKPAEVGTGHKLVIQRKNTFKGWHCNIIRNRLNIRINGDVFGASCKTAGKYCIGNINTGLQLDAIPNLPIVCENDFCPCVPDIKIPKEKV